MSNELLKRNAPLLKLVDIIFKILTTSISKNYTVQVALHNVISQAFTYM